MAESKADSRGELQSPLARIAGTTTVAADGTRRGVVVTERPAGLALGVTAQKGLAADVRASLGGALGVAIPEKPAIVHGHAAAVLWSGPGKWLVLAPAERAIAATEAVRKAAAGRAAVVDQSHARVQIGLEGPRVRDTLAKLIGIDVDAHTFPAASAAMTVIAHIPVHVWREVDRDGSAAFEIAGPQSYAESLWHHVVVSAAEYGLEARTLVAGRG